MSGRPVYLLLAIYPEGDAYVAPLHWPVQDHPAPVWVPFGSLDAIRVHERVQSDPANSDIAQVTPDAPAE